MSHECSYDVIVVGAGMFGSSAAKHIRQLQPNLRVAVIGPDNNSGSLARGQHFDEARICRRIEVRSQWAYLNDLGIRSYRATEVTSGIDFYTPCGCVWVGTAANRDAVLKGLESVKAFVATNDAECDSFPAVVDDETVPTAAVVATAAANRERSVISVTTSAEAAETVLHNSIYLSPMGEAGEATYYMVESGATGGGTVHPSRYVAAQLVCAALVQPVDHFEHVKDVVVHIDRIAGSDPGAGVYHVKTAGDCTYRAPRVLVATAAFAKYHQLIPAPVARLLRPLPAYVALLQVQPPYSDVDQHAENVKASALFPSVVCTVGEGEGTHFYALPPRYYEDRGGWFIKAGRASDWPAADGDTEMETLEQAMEWYETGKTVPLNHPEVIALATRLKKLYTAWPTVCDAAQSSTDSTTTDFHIVRCIFDETANELPLIGSADGEGLHCVMGGCGRGAKACDPIGAIAAHRLLGKALPPSLAFAKDLFHPLGSTTASTES